jgi:catechol 2,3-dioxygenase-like lactoylglutathione lyase family enzyme
MLAGSSLVYIFAYVRDLRRSRRFYEDKLRLRVVEEDSESVKYSAGGLMIALNEAARYGVQLSGDPDDTSLIVFHVDNVDNGVQELTRTGVEFGETLRYEIGATASFYDPDGHCLTLYEPSEEAMSWASGSKLASLIDASGYPAGARGPTLTASPVTYLFLFVRDVEEAAEFYQEKLGLTVLEEDPGAGVVKYDAGSVILSTHLIGGDAFCAVDVEAALPKTIAAVLMTDDVAGRVAGLTARGVHFDEPLKDSVIGTTARFSDPSGHIWYLYEPSQQALASPSGKFMLASAKMSPTTTRRG